MTELLLGCGATRLKQMSLGVPDWDDLVTVDINPDHKPDIIHDISKLPLPFADNTFDEIHAYEVLEHVGQQGDWRFFLDQWSDFWRILKPGGVVLGHSPHYASAWAWGDPGHTRIISLESFTYLCQPEYDKQIGKTPMTDYRFYYKADFNAEIGRIEGEHILFGLRAIKPSRISI
jgi:SAM-dependent methyltransferase